MRTRKHRRPALLVVIAVLIILLPLLAYLQYDWLGKVSEREREQMQGALRRTLSEFSQDFDREIARMFIQFQNRPDRPNHGLADYEKLYAHWNATAPYPRLIRDVLYDESDPQGFRLERLDVASAAWQPADWVSEFGPQGGLSSPIDPRIPAVVIPIFEMEKRTPDPQDPPLPLFQSKGRLILRLNLDYIQREFVPALVRSHFAAATDFRLQITGSDDGSRIIYSSDPASSIQGDGDATENILTLRLDRFRTLMPAEMPFVTKGAAIGMRGDRVFSFRVETMKAPGMIGQAIVDEGVAWKISAVHRAGSLDAAVAQLRHRNLGISFSILAVLAAGIGIVVLSAARAQRLAQQQIEFVSAVSHELRTPLAVIYSAGENLADGVVRDPERLKSYGRVIRDEGRRLTEMVEQVLSFAGLQSGLRKQTFVRVDLAEIVDRALYAFDIPIRENGFTVERRIPQDLPSVMAEPVSLTRAVHNLISNAIKYAGAERWIGLSVLTEGPWLKLTVQDRGPGIPSADLQHIFEPFYRGRAAIEGQIHGSGLGLSLVKQAVEQHNGFINVASNPGIGSTFSICLPVVQTSEISSV